MFSADMLRQVGRVHPQALLFPLVVATKSINPARVQAAEGIVARLRTHSPVLVEQVRPKLPLAGFLPGLVSFVLPRVRRQV
jgi:FKBP12-rapamycin complex-associated protein